MFLQCNVMKLPKDELNINGLQIILSGYGQHTQIYNLICAQGEGEKDGGEEMVNISITEIMIFHYFLPKSTEAYISCPYPDPQSPIWEGGINQRKCIQEIFAPKYSPKQIAEFCSGHSDVFLNQLGKSLKTLHLLPYSHE